MLFGRTPKFKTPEELQAVMEEYFASEGHWTITGLCLHCGFESRQSFYDYEKKDEFSYTIKKARMMIEHGYEKALMSDKVTGPIFALKNLGWSDKQDVQMSGGLNLSGVSDTELDRKIQSLLNASGTTK